MRLCTPIPIRTRIPIRPLPLQAHIISSLRCGMGIRVRIRIGNAALGARHGRVATPRSSGCRTAYVDAFFRNSKFQAPTSRESSIPKPQNDSCVRVWSLMIGDSLEIGCWDLELLKRACGSKRSILRNEPPCVHSFCSSRLVQSQSQHAHGSVPFSCRQFRRECASLTRRSSKYFSQYGRSSASGGSQKQTSTQVATPFSLTRACSMSWRYSSPAIEPRPRVDSSIARRSACSFPDFNRASTR